MEANLIVKMVRTHICAIEPYTAPPGDGSFAVVKADATAAKFCARWAHWQLGLALVAAGN